MKVKYILMPQWIFGVFIALSVLQKYDSEGFLRYSLTWLFFIAYLVGQNNSMTFSREEVESTKIPRFVYILGVTVFGGFLGASPRSVIRQ
ncbi:hypothetical protein [Bdellovibrio bacteriovorus]|uniref:hypothetical protein n=1 Tax=Bdellovibrio bacteriovorus TaxID=959 RepID=UPI0035A81E6F